VHFGGSGAIVIDHLVVPGIAWSTGGAGRQTGLCVSGSRSDGQGKDESSMTEVAGPMVTLRSFVSTFGAAMLDIVAPCHVLGCW
jgi:hypothetical protein